MMSTTALSGSTLVNPFINLPADPIKIIINYLPKIDRINFSTVCVRFFTLCNQLQDHRLYNLKTVPNPFYALRSIIPLSNNIRMVGSTMQNKDEEVTNLTLNFSPPIDGNDLSLVITRLTRLTKLTALKIHCNSLAIGGIGFSQTENTVKLLTAIASVVPPLNQLKLHNFVDNCSPSIFLSIQNFNLLTTLFLEAYKGLKPISSDIARLTTLETLVIQGSLLSGLPDEMTRLTNLTSLVIDGFHLSTPPSPIARLFTLENLSISSHALKSFPPTFSQLASLKILELNCPRLSSIPDFITHLTQLQKLSIKIAKNVIYPLMINRLVGQELREGGYIYI